MDLCTSLLLVPAQMMEYLSELYKVKQNTKHKITTKVYYSYLKLLFLYMYLLEHMLHT